LNTNILLSQSSLNLESILDIDHYYRRIGQIGLYQLSICILASLTSVISAISSYETVFVDATPAHR
jgi:HPt (histidine-containing phosphotransfer) domain-containing protein